MAEAVFVVDPVSFNHAFRSWDGMVGRHLLKVGAKHRALSMVSAPGPGKRPRNRTMINYATGELQVSIINSRNRHNKDLEIRTIALPKHALFVHEGTRPHVIVPRRKEFLVFFSPKAGRLIRTKKVMHPGTREIPFLAENLRRAVGGVALSVG